MLNAEQIDAVPNSQDVAAALKNLGMAGQFSAAVESWEFCFGRPLTTDEMRFAGHFFAAGFNAALGLEASQP